MNRTATTVVLEQWLADRTNPKWYGKFASKYWPFLRRFCRKKLQEADAEEMAAAILLDLAQARILDRFVFSSKEKFEHWLCNRARWRILQFWRELNRSPLVQGEPDWLQQVAEKVAEEAVEICEEDRALVREVEKRVRARSSESSWQAFKSVAVEGENVKAVASRLNMSDAAVYGAISRVRRRLRAEWDASQK